MTMKHTIQALLLASLIAALSVAQCGYGPVEWSADDRAGGSGDRIPPACDPDGLAPCPEGYFICTEDSVAGKRCEEESPAVPDDQGGWVCVDLGAVLQCVGDHMPPSTGDWTCVPQADGSVQCERPGYVPDAGGEGFWSCWYEGEMRICELTPAGDDGPAEGEGEPDDGLDDGPADMGGGGGDGSGGGSELPEGGDDEGGEPPDTGDGGDGDGDGDGDDEGGEPPDTGDGGDDGGDCLCIPGAWRYCDTPTYCRWGVQYCDPDGLRWGSCDEVSAVPRACSSHGHYYNRAAESCCISEGFCCQDLHDLDGDGDTAESLGDCTDIECV